MKVAASTRSTGGSNRASTTRWGGGRRVSGGCEIETLGQAVGQLALEPEAGHHVGGRHRGQVAQGAQAQASQDVDQALGVGPHGRQRPGW